MRNYSLTTFRQDVVAGLVVSLVALPLAMALSIAVGLPPQHGIYTAIVAGFIIALLGGSTAQVSGPTAAFVVIIAPIISQYGLHGIIWCQIIAGLFLLMGAAKLGRYVKYIPYPVVTGFTAGIAIVIGTLALNDFFGLDIRQLQGNYFEKIITLIQHFSSLNPHEFFIGLLTLLTILFCTKRTKKLPAPIIGVMVGTIAGYVMTKFNIELNTIGSRFTFASGQEILHGIPPYPPVFHLPDFNPNSLFNFPSFEEFKNLFIPSVIIAILAALESLLSATVADNMTGTKHDPNAELNAVGIGNILSGLAAGLPATGAIARTATNIQSGAKTPIAAVIHSILILFYVLLFAPFVAYVPMAALAALLLSTAYHMSHIEQVIRTIKIAPISDSIVLFTCLSLTVFVDMVAGVSAGILMAVLFYFRQMARTKASSQRTELAFQNQPLLPQGVLLHRINGPLYFGTSEATYDQQLFNQEHVNIVIFDLERVPLIDMTGLVAMKSMLTAASQNGRKIILCGRQEIVNRILHKINDLPVRQYIKNATSVREAIARELIEI